MTPRQFDKALEAVGWSRRHLAAVLSCDTNLPTRWGRGDAPIPVAIANWLALLAEHHRQTPAPVNWKTR